MIFRDLSTRRRHVDVAVDAVVGEPLGEAANHLEHLAPRRRHRLGRRHAHVEEEIRAMRGARHPPAEATLQRADVDDRLRATVRVLGIVLPGRDPLEHRVQHFAHPQDRVLVALALAEGRVDEVARRRDSQPERAEVAEHDLLLGRLTQHAHIGEPAVCHEMAGTARIAAELRALRVAVLRLLDLAAHRRDEQVALQSHTRIQESTHSLDVAGQRALHVGDPEPVEPALPDERLRLEPRDVREPRLAAGVRGVHMAVEHQCSPAARPRERAEHVRPPLLDLLPLHLQPVLLEGLLDEPRHLLLAAREARDRDRLARPLDQPVAVDGQFAHRTCGRTRSPKSRICSCRRSPQSSSMTWVQPASLYSSIAAMQSSGVPAIGLHLSSSASLTSALAASRPPRSIASATGRISSCSMPARSSSVSAEPWMFWTLLARYIPAISRAPSRPASPSDSWIDATIVQPMSMSAATFWRV